jgi:hypothetical protein
VAPWRNDFSEAGNSHPILLSPAWVRAINTRKSLLHETSHMHSLSASTDLTNTLISRCSMAVEMPLSAER